MRFLIILFLALQLFSFTKPVRAEISTLNILTLNTWMIPLQRKMAKARAEAIGKNLTKYDLAFFQEAFSAGIRKTIATNAKQSEFFNRYQVSSAFQLNSGKFTLGRLKITKTGFKPFTRCGGLQCLAGKGVLYVQFMLANGKLIDTFNTHLQAYEKDVKIRQHQLKEAITYVNKINNGSLPALFVGDFNVIASTSEYSSLTNKLFGFRDVWPEVNAGDPGFTWNPSVNYWAKYDYDESTLLQRLDYIFVRDGKESFWHVNSAALAFNEEVSWKGVYIMPRKTYASDHFGVEAELELISE